MKWEYYVEDTLEWLGEIEANKYLHGMGENGWELETQISDSLRTYFFKRPKRERGTINLQSLRKTANQLQAEYDPAKVMSKKFLWWWSK